MKLTDKDKDILLDIVKTSIAARLAGRDFPDFQVKSEILKEKRGAFVTLRKNGHLRGCIGYIEARKPLYQTVEEMAVAAAFHDPRFPQLNPEEFRQLSFEISVLTPLQEIRDIHEIEVGKHGIYITNGLHTGLLLPQVATEHCWDRMTFLEETCNKAGMPPRAWKDKDTKIYIFSADIF
jgi:AmmeMemoRadiSam system protein A